MHIPSDPAIVVSAALPPQTLIVAPDEGKTLHAYGDTAQIKLSGEQTNGSIVIALGTTPPGGGPPPHRHRIEDEIFLVVDGTVRFLANGEWTKPLKPGTGLSSFFPKARKSSQRSGREAFLTWRESWRSAVSTRSNLSHLWDDGRSPCTVRRWRRATLKKHSACSRAHRDDVNAQCRIGFQPVSGCTG
jgi:hypothetical protein